MRIEMTDDDKPPPPLCCYCSAPWTDDMLKVFVTADLDFGYYPSEFSMDGADAVIDVTCSSCGRLVYRKEIRATQASYR